MRNGIGERLSYGSGWAIGFFLILLVALLYSHHIILPTGGSEKPFSLWSLPFDAAFSFVRMLFAYILSFIFALTYGYLSAKSRFGKPLLLPLLDVLQSVPVLGFFPAAVFFFVQISGGARFGVEMASIFLIFTSQAWNMTFSVYESITTIPDDVSEAVGSFGLSPLQKYKKLYFPASIPKLVYNSMLSWAGGWYFLIACEIISLGPIRFRLPGIGSFLVFATEKGNIWAILAGLIVLISIILFMHFFIWKPLLFWSTRYRYELGGEGEHPRSLFVTLGFRMRTLRRLRLRIRLILSRIPLPEKFFIVIRNSLETAFPYLGRITIGILIVLLSFAFWKAGNSLISTLSNPIPPEVNYIIPAIFFSFLRLLCAYVLTLLWTIPVVLLANEYSGLRRLLMPVAEIGASLPATALFPLIVFIFVDFFGGMNIASVILILTGMQWYILFNLLSGIQSIPDDLREATRAMGLTFMQKTRKLTLPAIVPSLITGSITGWGGGWNALIISEYFIYHEKTFSVLGIGSLLDKAIYYHGNSLLIFLSLASMVIAIITLNHIVWRPLYARASERYSLNL